jgi:formylglycine-generating enzyme required for sulfatase activity
MGKHTVTQAEYAQHMKPVSSWTKKYGHGESYPAYNVSWYDIIKYCNLRSIAEGLTPVYSVSGSTDPANWSDKYTWNYAVYNCNADGYRLPTEAEWEYAARGATNTPYHQYSGSDTIGDVAWYFGNNKPYGSKPVGKKAPNSLGLYDMSGNVSEWCWDWYEDYSSRPSSNPTGPASGLGRVLRGGCWEDNANECRVEFRYYIDPFHSFYLFGFRIVRNAL